MAKKQKKSTSLPPTSKCDIKPYTQPTTTFTMTQQQLSDLGQQTNKPETSTPPPPPSPHIFPEANYHHGHNIPRYDKIKRACGYPNCAECKAEAKYAQKRSLKLTYSYEVHITMSGVTQSGAHMDRTVPMMVFTRPPSETNVLVAIKELGITKTEFSPGDYHGVEDLVRLGMPKYPDLHRECDWPELKPSYCGVQIYGVQVTHYFAGMLIGKITVFQRQILDNYGDGWSRLH
jgi:hypothetical protein